MSRGAPEAPPPVTVGIDARKIRDFGIGRYVEGLLGGLAELGGSDRFVLFLGDPTRASLPGSLPVRLDPERFRLVRCAAPLYSLVELVAFRGAGPRHALDVLHFPHYVRAFAPGCPVAVTIHDAIHLSHPPSRRARLYARAMMTWSARTADLLFADTAAARDDLVRRLGVSADRFRVVPLAADRRFAPPNAADVARFRDERGLPRDMVVIVGSHRPHKNLAAAATAARTSSLPSGAVVVTARDRESAARTRAIVGGDVRVLHPVGDDDLPLLFAAARIVLVPSLAEGFGLPALEAAACGAAVLATPIPAHREVMGDAAAWTRSGEIADLREALEALWTDDARLAALRQRGPERASRYDWRTTAEATLAGWRDVARGRPASSDPGASAMMRGPVDGRSPAP